MNFQKAKDLLNEFKGEDFKYGINILDQTGKLVSDYGKRVAFIHGQKGLAEYFPVIKDSLKKSGVEIVADIKGAAPNTPLEDLQRISDGLKESECDVLLGFGSGSTLDCIKAAEVLRTLGGSIEDYFGMGLVTKKLSESGLTLTPFVAVQSAASSAAHLTKYSNITDMKTGQKKLIVDEAIVPPKALFDYKVTTNCPTDLTIDGALDGFSQSLEVFYGSVNTPHYNKMRVIEMETTRLILNYLPRVLENPQDIEARTALGLATDLGGYAIMIGGTNGAHLTSFSLVDVLSHGRACGMLNPYYTVFFAPAVEEPLRDIGSVFNESGYNIPDLEKNKGKNLGIAVAEAMLEFIQKINIPTKLDEVKGFSDQHIERALNAAKNPQLKMKLENMPVALTAEMIDEYMKPVLMAAKTGDLSLIKNV
jgi:alcohol dehydrogenase class IV